MQNIFRAINIVMDSGILDQLNNLGKEVDSEVKAIKTRVDGVAKRKPTLKRARQ